MKLFALGRIVSAGSVYIGLAGEVAKFTEMAIITLRILSSVGSRDALRATLGASVQYRWCRCWTPWFDTLSKAYVYKLMICLDMAVFNGF